MTTFVRWVGALALLASSNVFSQSAAALAWAGFQESRQICLEVSRKLAGQTALQNEIIEVRDFEQRNQLLYEKSGIDAELLGRYKRQSGGEGVYLGNSFHGAPLSYYVAKSDGLYCGVGRRHLLDAEKSGGTEASWKLRRIYLDEIFKNTSLPWIECCLDISQEDFLKSVEEAAGIYRIGRARTNLQHWSIDVASRSIRSMQLTFKSLGTEKTADGVNPYGADYRAGVRRDTKKFIAALKKLVR